MTFWDIKFLLHIKHTTNLCMLWFKRAAIIYGWCNLTVNGKNWLLAPKLVVPYILAYMLHTSLLVCATFSLFGAVRFGYCVTRTKECIFDWFSHSHNRLMAQICHQLNPFFVFWFSASVSLRAMLPIFYYINCSVRGNYWHSHFIVVMFVLQRTWYTVVTIYLGISHWMAVSHEYNTCS